MRQRTGSIFKRESVNKQTGKKEITWWARLTYIDDQGRHRDLQRRAENKTNAREIRDKLLVEHDTHGAQSFDHERKTFADLADHFENKYLKLAEYAQERKISGYRALRGLPAALKAARDYFGRQLLRSITYGDLAAYRALRLKTPSSF